MLAEGLTGIAFSLDLVDVGNQRARPCRYRSAPVTV